MNLYDVLAGQGTTHFERLFSQKFAGGGKTQTLTGIPPISFKADGKPLISWSMKGNCSQSGTPTPDNPVDFVGCGIKEMYEVSVTYQSSAYTYDVKNGGLVDAIKQLGAGRYTFSWDFQSNATGTFKDRLRLYVNGVNKMEIANGNTRDFTETLVQEIQNAQNFSIQLYYGQGNTDGYFKDFVIDAGYKIPISCAGQTVPIYLGQVQTTRRIRKLVLTGEETFTYYNTKSSKNVMNLSVPDSLGVTTGNNFVFCTHLPRCTQAEIYGETVERGISTRPNSQILFYDTSIANVPASFKSYLQQQYAAGTPVVVWYVLADSQTGIVNEPLAKIGDYADELHSEDAGVSIPTAKGQNTLTVDTELQPSSMTITFK